MRLVIFSDVQANEQALRAVLADIDALENVNQVISTGNAIGLGPRPNEVLDLLREHKVESVMGNYEDAIVNERLSSGMDFPDEGAERVDRVAIIWTRKHLTAENAKYVTDLPRNVRLIGSSFNMTLRRDAPDERIAETRRAYFLGSLGRSRKRPSRVPTRRILALHGSPRALNEAIRQETAGSILTTVGQASQADVVISSHGGEFFRREWDKVTYIGVPTVSGPRALPGTARYIVVDVDKEIEVDERRVDYDHSAHIQAIVDNGLPPALAATWDLSQI